MENISFRKKVNLSKKVEETVIEKARDYVERFLEIENILGIESNFKNPVKNLKIRNLEDTEKASEHLRKSWELGYDPISNITEMLELKGVKVYLIKEQHDVLYHSQGGCPYLRIEVVTLAFAKMQILFGIFEKKTSILHRIWYISMSLLKLRFKSFVTMHFHLAPLPIRIKNIFSLRLPYQTGTFM